MSAPSADDAGIRHPQAGPDARILSLVPSLTELLFDLGLGGRVCGRTHYCVEPEGPVGAVPAVGGTKKVNMAKVRALRPTHAVVNVDENPKAMAEALAHDGVEVVVTHPVEVADNVRLYRLMGGIFGAAERAAALTEAFEAAYQRLRARADVFPPRRVLYLIWKAPWMTVAADTYVARMLALVGWQGIAGPSGGDDAKRYPEIELSKALLAEADYVLFSSEPYAFTEDDVAAFRARFPAHAEKARLVDGQLLSWYGSRAIKGLEYLEKISASFTS
ncbi:MAG: helical backbone metal receptor [Rhodospirillales bacterium]